MAEILSQMLSGDDIRKFLGYEIPIFTTPMLYKLNNIDQIFFNEHGDKFNDALLLYQQSNSNTGVVGHWTVVKRLDSNNIVHFDSYGMWPDKQLEHIEMSYRKRTNQVIKYLSKLLVKSTYKNIHYNNHRLQNYWRMLPSKSGAGDIKVQVNTCGRHCICYIKSNKEPESYYQMMKTLKNKVEDVIDGYTTYDELVCGMTISI